MFYHRCVSGMAAYGTELFPALFETLVWARDLAASGDVSAALPLIRLAVLRGIAPRTLRDHPHAWRDWLHSSTALRGMGRQERD